MESFRGECLNREQLWTLTEARVVIEDFRCEYNHLRPHSKLGNNSPARLAATLTQTTAPSSTPVALRAPYVGDGQNQPKTHKNNQFRLTLPMAQKSEPGHNLK